MTDLYEKIKYYLSMQKDTLKLFFYYCCLPSVLCCLFVEICSRASFLDTFLYILHNPIVFLFNVLIIATTATVCLLFRKRSFWLLLMLFLWAVVGVTDMILLVFRTTPFTAVDLLLIKSALTIMNRYMSPFMIVVTLAALLLAIAGLVYLFVKAKKSEDRINYYVRVPFAVGLVFLMLFLADIGMATKLLDRNFGNLAQAFHENGLPYCFMNSLINTGINEPDNYSREEVDKLVEVTPVPEENNRPNIIFLQLESFFDPKHIWNFTYNTDPVQYFTYLKKNYPSGYLSVPSIGAGTANTEFECITGMNLDFFGPGEYPYKTILDERTCESLPYALRNLGYITTAIHNNDGTFYERHEVFPNLGFDRFVSIEYMKHAEVNELDWARDHVLIEEITNVLRQTPERDYIYTISVQGHGAYPEESIVTDPSITIQLPEELAEYQHQYEYYVNQLAEMDNFLMDLTLTLSAWPEDTVLVLYGDHLPGLGLEQALLENGNLFQTEYVIWTNFEIEAEDRDMEAYQLGAHLCEILDIPGGIMTQFHINHEGTEEYLENMELLMYDMLYGDMGVYGGKNPHERTRMQMGILPIEILNVYYKKLQTKEDEPVLFVVGENFTEFSYIEVNGEILETIYLNESLLAAKKIPEEAEDGYYYFSVVQQGNDEIVLSRTGEYVYKAR